MASPPYEVQLARRLVTLQAEADAMEYNLTRTISSQADMMLQQYSLGEVPFQVAFERHVHQAGGDLHVKRLHLEVVKGQIQNMYRLNRASDTPACTTGATLPQSTNPAYSFPYYPPPERPNPVNAAAALQAWGASHQPRPSPWGAHSQAPQITCTTENCPTCRDIQAITPRRKPPRRANVSVRDQQETTSPDTTGPRGRLSDNPHLTAVLNEVQQGQTQPTFAVPMRNPPPRRKTTVRFGEAPKKQLRLDLPAVDDPDRTDSAESPSPLPVERSRTPELFRRREPEAPASGTELFHGRGPEEHPPTAAEPPPWVSPPSPVHSPTQSPEQRPMVIDVDS